MGRLALTFACGRYDRTLPLYEGRVVPEGIDLNTILLGYEELFWRMLRHEEFDVSELSLSSYLMARAQGKPELIAIPVFPARAFRHSSIYVNAQAAIREPKDLVGRRVGVPEYQMTAALWVRGILEHLYGVSPRDMTWFNGGLEQPDREEKLPLNLPPEVRLHPIASGKTLNQMLVQGELDALVTPRPPSAFLKGHPNVRRLFADYKTEETEYFKKTGIFPPMHTVVIRRRVYDANPWVAQSLYKAFCVAKQECTLDRMFDGQLRYALPLLHAAVEESKRTFGDVDMWPYGLEENRHTLETLVQYSFEQGLTPAPFQVESLFAATTLDTARN